MSDIDVMEKEAPDLVLPPTQDELPYDDGVPMETERHKLQMDLLIYPLKPWLNQRLGGGYVGGNMFVYFSLEQVRHQDFRGPDVFVVLDVPKRERKSWVVWEEGKSPDVVIELLSGKTADMDKGKKKIIYQNQLKVAEYFWFDPFNPEDWEGFGLHHGEYVVLARDDQNRFISERLGLALVRWQGVYEEVETTWLRWATKAGQLLPTSREALETASQRADAETQRADAETQRADAETQRADAETQRADAAEAELARLQGLLAENQGAGKKQSTD